MAKKNAIKKTVNAAMLLQLLDRVHLGGLLNECLLSCEEETFVQAVDMTNSVILRCSSNIDLSEFGQIGLGQLSVLCKYLKTCDGDVILSLNKDKNRLLISRTGGRLNYLLTHPKHIPTREDTPDIIPTIVKRCNWSVKVTAEQINELLYYLGLLKSKAVAIKVNKKGKVSVEGGTKSDHKFNVSLSSIKSLSKKKNAELKKGDTLTINIFGDHFASVLKTLKDAENVKLYLGGNSPLVIKAGEEATWALVLMSNKQDFTGDV